MKNLNIKALTLAIGIALSMSATAGSMTKDEYKLQETKINAEYKYSKVRCESLKGNPEDICYAEEKGKKNVALAELEHHFTNSVKSRYNLHVAHADADYAIAMQKCDAKNGNEEDVCEKEAKAAKVHAMADAKAQMSTSKLNAVANEKALEENIKATDKAAEAHQDAANAKRQADYAVAKEKCDALAGNVKSQCMNDAKINFGP